MRRTRGLRADWSAGAPSGSLTGGFAVNSASAASRALVIRSRSSPRGCGCCCRLSKISSHQFTCSRYREGDSLVFASCDLGAKEQAQTARWLNDRAAATDDDRENGSQLEPEET